MWVIMALGLNVVVGYAGLLDLGYVAFWAIGGYTAGWLMSQPVVGQLARSTCSSPPPLDNAPGIHINFWLVLIVAGVVCAIAGIIIGAPTLRLRGDYLALVTLGFGEMIAAVLPATATHRRLQPHQRRPRHPVDRPDRHRPVRQHPGRPEGTRPPSTTPTSCWCSPRSSAICLFISLRIRDGRLGRAWLAIREDELAASMMGVPLVRAKLSAYAVGAFFGGLGGVGFASAITGASLRPASTSRCRSSCCSWSCSAAWATSGACHRRGRAGLDQQHRPQPDRRPVRQWTGFHVGDKFKPNYNS